MLLIASLLLPYYINTKSINSLQTVLVYGLNDGGAGYVTIAAGSYQEYSVNLSDIDAVKDKTVLGIVGFNTGFNDILPASYRITSDDKLMIQLESVASVSRNVNPRAYLLYY